MNAFVSYKLAYSLSQGAARRFLIVGIVANISMLLYYKYALMLVSTLQYVSSSVVGEMIPSSASIPLPIGISFYTFEGISLLVDTYKKRQSHTGGEQQKETHCIFKHFITTLVFISFFPHLVAGPILKAGDFFPQIKLKTIADMQLSKVMRLLVTGYFLKSFVADNLKDYTFWISYPYFLDVGSITNVVMISGFAVQIYADFCGYSLIALGLGGLFGYSLPMNFYFPYLSSSLSEFWRRWHISLSSWLRDYLYIPLGGNRCGEARARANILIVMLIGGAWHGAAWSYVLWGAFHGVGLVVERMLRDLWPRHANIYRSTLALATVKTISCFAVVIFVTIGWVFFRLPDFAEAIKFFEAIIYNYHVKNYPSRILPVVLLSAPIAAYHLRHLLSSRANIAKASNIWLDEFALGVMLFLIVVNAGEQSPFIYFQF
jgi:alginate O-acetyltransferase complex protein AlgI